MPDEPKIARIEATINGGAYSAEGLKIQTEVNRVPVAQVTVAPNVTGESVQKPLTEEVLAAIRAAQDERLSGVEELGVDIHSLDGNEGELEFRGFFVSPVLEISRTHTANQFSALGLDAVLDSLDLSIYQAGYSNARLEDSPLNGVEGLQPQPAAKDGKITDLILNITNVLVDNFVVSLNKVPHETTRALFQHQHDINERLALQVWRDVLGNSGVVYESWAEVFKVLPSASHLLTERVKQLLTQKSEGFWNVVRGLMNDFQMYYVPSMEGSGKMVRADARVGAPTVDLEVSASGINVADGSRKIVQVGGVEMSMPALQLPRSEGGPSGEYPQFVSAVVASYPSPFLPGYIKKEVPPHWLARSDGVPILGSELDVDKGPKVTNLSLEEAQKRKGQADAFNAKADLSSEGVLTEMCEVMFKYLQLENSTAVLDLPLNYNIQVGDRANVTIREGGSFTAFVSGVVHSVDLRGGKQLNSGTQVSCTHVKF